MGEFDIGEFTKRVSENVEIKAVREAIFELLEFAEKNAWKVEGGKDNKTFQYLVRTQNSAKILFYCHSNGQVALYLGARFYNLQQAAITSFLNNFRSNPEFQFIMRFEDPRNRNTDGSQPFSIVKTLTNPTTMKQFQSAVLDLQKVLARTISSA